MEPKPSVRGLVWRSGKAQDEFVFDEISDYLAEADTLVWVDLLKPDHDELLRLAGELGLNTWAVEDTLSVAQRVKATLYRTHTFLTLYAVAVDERADTADGQSMLALQRISAFVLPQALITVRPSPAFNVDQLVERWDDIGALRYGVEALVHGLLDVVVDGQFDAVQALDDAVESLEDDLFNAVPAKGRLQRRSFQLRKDLVAFRRAVLPMREVINVIHRGRLDRDSPHELDPLYSDLYDHVMSVAEWTESLRDMITTVFETNLSLQDARLNSIMKKLTGWAAIIAVPTAITGFYGQNVPYPGFGAHSGFIASTAAMVVIVVVLYVMFRRRDWL